MANPIDGILKHLALAFLLSVILYATGFGLIEYRRGFRGPWRITFSADAAGAPSLNIFESKLHIEQKVIFPKQKAVPISGATVVQFDDVVTNLPFGRMIFQDPTFLPGTVTMSLYGHEVELLPRVLIIDKKEYPWRFGAVIELP